jgi:hypothetical protein
VKPDTTITADELDRRLRSERVVPISAADWAEVADGFEELERHDTLVAGYLLIVRGRSGLAAVEQPSPDKRVVRLLPDDQAVRRFVQDRLEQYERMWDGCGCKVDYYA